MLEEELENEKRLKRDWNGKKIIDEENDRCLACSNINEEIRREEIRREELVEQLRKQKIESEKEKRENDVRRNVDSIDRIRLFCFSSKIFQRIVESNEQELTEMKSLCEALRLENEDYQVVLLLFLHFSSLQFNSIRFVLVSIIEI